jgi:hypothetical protein
MRQAMKGTEMFTVSFETTGAAFDGAEFPEIAETLRKLALEVENPVNTSGIVRDYLGNTIGRWQWAASSSA